MKQSALTIPTLVTDQGHDTATGVVIVVLALIGLAFWAGAEFTLRSQEIDAVVDLAEREAATDRDAIAEVIGLVDQRRTATYAGEFADQVEARLRVIDGGQS